MVEFVKTTLFAGGKHGLAGPTAVCHWRVEQRWLRRMTSSQIEHLQYQADRLWPADPLPGIARASWPKVFLRESHSDSPLHWAVALTVALLRHAREPALRGHVLTVRGGDVWVALPYMRQHVLAQAMWFAWKLLDDWLLNVGQANKLVPAVFAELSAWLELVQAKGLAPNTLRFAWAAHALDIPVTWGKGLLRLGWGINAELMDSSFTGRTSTLGTRNARSKPLSSALLGQAAVPVPAQRVVGSMEQARQFVAKVGWPVVIKPANQDQGVGVVPAISDDGLLKKAFDAAAVYSPGSVVIEKHVNGSDHRLLVVGGRLLMATRRVPGGVVGDGVKCIAELVDAVNADPRRGTSKRSLMMRLVLDDEALDCLRTQGLVPTSVPPQGCIVALRRTANISTGGTAEDVTDTIHPDNVVVAERAARVLGLDIAGVDFLCPDISRSWREVGGAVCEVNAQPGFRPHWLSAPGRDVNAEILQWLFKDKSARIPTAAITGTNGKTTVARMLHHIWCEVGKVAGVCTTQGVWVGRDQVTDKNLSGYPGARVILEDSAVESAIIEMPRKGLVRFGHPCDRYDVAALLNVQDDHIGVDGIHSMEQMAVLKSQVLEMASKAVVLNAQDELCLALRAKTRWTERVILVANSRELPAVLEHLESGNEAVFVQMHQGAEWVVLACGAEQCLVMPVSEILAAMGGVLRVNVTNALFATAMAHAQGLPLPSVRKALQTFGNTPFDNPGRFNFIEGLPYQVLLDYGHNPDGIKELCHVVQGMTVVGRRRLLNLKIGNRHKVHLTKVAHVLAQTFDGFVLGCDAGYVAKSADYAGADPVACMLSASKDALLAAGVLEGVVVAERDYQQAIRTALEGAQAGDLVVLLAEPWEALPILQEKLSTYRESMEEA